MLASSFYDVVLGLDVHFEMVPTPAPTPTPVPNPFTGIVFDPLGLGAGLVVTNLIGAAIGAPFKGPVIYWGGTPATNTGTEAMHVPGHIIIPPGTAWAPFPKAPKPVIRPGEVPEPDLPVKPADDAVIITGSKTVTVMGTNAVRLGDLALSCSEPVRLPSSVVMAVPKGAPILIGGPPSLDLLAAALGSIRTRYVSDSLHSLVSRLRSARLRNLLHRSVCFFTGHPVDVATGKVVTDAVDAELPGPLPLKIERSYSSAFAARRGPLGVGWSLSLDQAVWRERGKVVLLADDGREIEFDTFDLPGHMILPGDSVYNPIERLALRCLEGNRWSVESHDGVVREFAPAAGRNDGRARLQRIRSRCGHHEITFEYDDRGRLAWVRDSGGRLIALKHDDADRVTALELPLPNGHGWYTHRRYEYDDEGDLTSVTDSQGHHWSFEYETHLLVRETDRTGLSFYFVYDGFGQDAWCVRTWGDDGIYDHEIAYDKRNHVTAVTDSLGRSTLYHMNIAGQVVKTVDPLGGETVYEHDPISLALVAETDALGQRTSYVLDRWGDPVRVEGPDGSVAAIEYDDRLHLPLRATDPAGGRWSWAYDSLGNVLAAITPTGETTRFDWEGGLLRSLDEPGERRTTFDYDEQKNPRRLTLPNGAEENSEHDVLGRVVRHRDARGGVRKASYDTEGRVLETTSPVGLSQRMRYDPEGNLLEAETATRRVQLRYAGFHRVVEREEGGTVIRFEHDTEDRLTGVVNEAGERYGFELDEAGRVKAEVGFDGGRRLFFRDRAGQVNREVLPSGSQREMTYDPAGRLTQVQRSDGSTTSFEYRADGALMRASNDETEVVYERDPLGRILSEEVDGVRVTSRYGPDGARALVESSLGARQSIELDALGEVAALRHGQPRGFEDPLEQRFERDALGLETARVLPGGIRVSWQRDESGRPLQRRSTRVSDGVVTDELGALSYQWRGDDQISALIDAVRGPRFFDHDARGRLVRERRSDEVIDRAMDEVGNIYRRADRTDRRYGPGGRIEEAEGTRYEHDADGNLTLKSAPDGSIWRYRWNGAGMLREIERPDGKLVRFEYDPFARRTRKTVVTVDAEGAEQVETDHRFVWDGHNVLHEREGADDLTTWYWQPDSFTPVAKERSTRQWLISTDHLGTPTELHDEWGALTWQMRLDVYGESTIDEGASTDCPWRWPGQYEDEETGDYYNRHRNYSPGAGGYTTLDPLGLVGGLSLFGYVRDTLLSIDPFGLVRLDQTGMALYHIVDATSDEVVYVGISNDLLRRRSEHINTGRIKEGYDLFIAERNLTYGQARGYEQADISHYGTRDTSRIGETIEAGDSNRRWSYNPLRSDDRALVFEKHRRQRQKGLGGCT